MLKTKLKLLQDEKANNPFINFVSYETHIQEDVEHDEEIDIIDKLRLFFLSWKAKNVKADFYLWLLQSPTNQRPLE